MGHGPDGNPLRITYEEIHITIGEAAARIKAEFDPDMMIAIGGGGFFPARVLRTFLKYSAKNTGSQRNIPIQAIGLSLYEELGNPDGTEGLASPEKLGTEVVRTQWLDFSTLGNRPLVGRRILIVDEVDDSRTTLGYACAELQKDIAEQYEKLTPELKASLPETKLAVFVVHNKIKEKRGAIPEGIAYFPGANIEDRWVDYPWEQQDILLHNKKSLEAGEPKQTL